MLRSMRRQVRGWREDFLRYWGRLRSFHRVALAILLALAILPTARRYVLDPLKGQIGEARAALQEKEAPEVITLPDEDPEVLELQLKIESLEETLVSHRAKTRQAVAAWPDFSTASKGTILAAFGELISQSGMTRLEFRDAATAPLDAPAKSSAGTRPSRTSAARASAKTPEKTPAQAPGPAADKEPLESARYRYVLAGSFEDVRGFLTKIDKFAYPAKIEQASLQLAGGGDGPGAALPLARPNTAPELHLSYYLKLYFHD
jgi:hypothetical protein